MQTICFVLFLYHEPNKVFHMFLMKDKDQLLVCVIVNEDLSTHGVVL